MPPWGNVLKNAKPVSLHMHTNQEITCSLFFFLSEESLHTVCKRDGHF